LDVNLTGVWHTVKSAVPHMIRQGTGGAIVITSSSTATKPVRNLGAYSSAKSGLTGLMKVLALELAHYSIRVNTVNPGSVGTPMLLSDRIFRLFRPDLEQPTAEDARPVFESLNALPTPWVEAEDVSNAVAWLVSDEARFVTGAVIPVDAGATLI
jgi:(+)-trans-carveol dehydrogenase